MQCTLPCVRDVLWCLQSEQTNRNRMQSPLKMYHGRTELGVGERGEIRGGNSAWRADVLCVCPVRDFNQKTARIHSLQPHPLN